MHARYACNTYIYAHVNKSKYIKFLLAMASASTAATS